jgi:hypothetical protein
MLGETVAGYRLVRKLGEGSRAVVFLGHAGGEHARTAAVKVFRAGADPDSISAEISALSAADHAHVVQLRDVSGGGDGRPALIFERLELGSLGTLLASRVSLSAGEAVTILAPLAAAVSALQSSGVAHAAITASRVLFRESGAPVLAGFGHAVVGASASQLEADGRDLAGLASAVLERVPEADPVRLWLSSIAVHRVGFADQLSERLFAMAEATPVRFASSEPAAHLVPARSHSAAPVETELPPTVQPWRAKVDQFVERVPARLRKPRYAAIAAGALTVLIAFAAVPSGGRAADLEPTAAPTTIESGPVVEDDPVPAFAQLVRARNACIRDLSILCLDTVLQADSAAMDDDIALIRSIERGQGGSAVLEPTNVSVVERLGDAVLLGFQSRDSAVTSVLLVRSDAGWRIRSYIAG